MKDAMTYANEAGFFSFNVIGWKAEFERLIEAVRADAIADHIRDATKISQDPVGQVDSTPHLHVGHSSFEDWYQAHSKASGGDKQLARDAYAAGMGDPLVSSVEPAKQEPAEYLMEVTCTKCGATESGVLKFKDRVQPFPLIGS